MMVMRRTGILLGRHGDTPWLGPHGAQPPPHGMVAERMAITLCSTYATYGGREANPTTGLLNRHGLSPSLCQADS